MFGNKDEFEAALAANRGRVPKSPAQRRADHAAFDKTLAETWTRKQQEARVGELRGHLDEVLRERLTRARYDLVRPNELSDETKKRYATNWARFVRWCAAEGVPSLPSTDEVVAGFLFESCGQTGDFKPATAVALFAAIRSKHRLADLPEPDGAYTKAVRDWLNEEPEVTEQSAEPDQPKED
jgi:hypothetical protein